MSLLHIQQRKSYSLAVKEKIHNDLAAMDIERSTQLYQFLFTQMYVTDMAAWDDKFSPSDIPMEEM